MADGMMGITPTYNLAQRDDMGGSWFWIILILLFGGRGFGYAAEQGIQNNFIENEFLKRDIFNTNTNVSAQGCTTQKEVLESRYTTQLGLQNLGQNMSDCCCSIKSEGFKNTTEILSAIHADGEATRAMIQSNYIQDLRDRLAQSQRETDTANLALQNNAQTQTLLAQINKVPQPAYITCSPYVSYGYNPCGCASM